MSISIKKYTDRRSQYIITGQNVPSSVETSSVEDDLEYGPRESDRNIDLFGVDEDEEEDFTPQPLPGDESLMNNLQWDEDLVNPVAQSLSQRLPVRTGRNRQQRSGQGRTDYQTRPLGDQSAHISSPPAETNTEQTPLLQKVQSKSSIILSLPTSRRDSESGVATTSLARQDGKSLLKHKISSVSTRSEKPTIGGKSTFGQTVSICVYLLHANNTEACRSEVIQFYRHSSWIRHAFGAPGVCLRRMDMWHSPCHMLWTHHLLYVSEAPLNKVSMLKHGPRSAKILAHIMLDDPQIRTYADIGNKAFGHRSRFITSTLFCLELFSVR